MKASAFSYARATSVANAHRIARRAWRRGEGAFGRPEPDARDESASDFSGTDRRYRRPRRTARHRRDRRMLADRRADAPCRSPEFARNRRACAAVDASHRPCRASRDPQPGHASAAASRMPIRPSELPACMVALDATIIVQRTGRRTPGCGRGFLHGNLRDGVVGRGIAGRRRTARRAKECRAFLLRIRAASRRLRHCRPGCAGDRAKAMSSTDLRLAFFAVGDRPVLAKAATKLLNVAVTPAVLSGSIAGPGDELDPQEDQQASASMRRHLAKVLLARCVATLLGRPELAAGGAWLTATVPISLQVNGERIDAQVLPRPQSGGLPARASEADGDACRLRAWGVRRLHGARQRRYRSFLPDAGGADATAHPSRPSRDCPTAARSPICRLRFAIATRCNAASVRRACWSRRRTC